MALVKRRSFAGTPALFEEGSQGNEPYIPRARLSYPYSAV